MNNQQYKASIENHITFITNRLQHLQIEDDLDFHHSLFNDLLSNFRSFYFLNDSISVERQTFIDFINQLFSGFTNEINSDMSFYIFDNPELVSYYSFYSQLLFHFSNELKRLIEQQSIIPLTLTKSKAKVMTSAKAKRLKQLKALKQWLVYQAEPKKMLARNVYFARAYHQATTSNLRKNHLNEV